MTGGHMEPVHESLRAYKAAGVHLELVTLIVPEHNDSPEHLRQLADWVVADLGPDVPLHFSRFSPMYKLTNLRRTPTETLEMARETAMAAGVKYAYIGNVPGNDGENTYCPSCKELLIRRLGYQTEVVGMTLATGQCNHCNEKIPGIWTKQG
jgi:pyruvate formate lyase activating enzyme